VLQIKLNNEPSLKEIIKKETTTADLIAEQLTQGDWTMADNLFKFMAGWISRQREALRDGERTAHAIALDISDYLDSLSTPIEFNQVQKQLIDDAIHFDYPVIQEFKNA
jgi:hypothetical protein